MTLGRRGEQASFLKEVLSRKHGPDIPNSGMDFSSARPKILDVVRGSYPVPPHKTLPLLQLVAGFSRKANLSGSYAGTGFGPVLANRLKCWFFGWHKWLEASGDKRFQRN